MPPKGPGIHSGRHWAEAAPARVAMAAAERTGKWLRRIRVSCGGVCRYDSKRMKLERAAREMRRTTESLGREVKEILMAIARTLASRTPARRATLKDGEPVRGGGGTIWQ